MTTYYHRRRADGEIINASETDLSRAELEARFPPTDYWFYDPNPPLHVLERYQFWNERP